jgi:hypothetical protein
MLSKHYYLQTVARFHPEHGLPLDSNGGVLENRPGLKRGDQAMEVTNPYGVLRYAVGSAEDFYCFDFALVDGKRNRPLFVLDSAIHSQTGLQSGVKPDLLVTPQDAVHAARDLVIEALEWCGSADVKHDRKVWNQDPAYFFRTVFINAAPFFRGVEGPDIERLGRFADTRQLRFGGKRIEAMIRKYFGEGPI